MNYTMEEAAKAVGVERINLVMWVRRGIIPEPDKSHRPMVYSEEQVRQIEIFVRLSRVGMERGLAGWVAEKLANEKVGKYLVDGEDGYYKRIEKLEDLEYLEGTGIFIQI